MAEATPFHEPGRVPKPPWPTRGHPSSFDKRHPGKQACRELLVLANGYQSSRGFAPHPEVTPYSLVDELFAARIADCYEDLQHAPHDSDVARSYAAFKIQILSQWLHLHASGWVVEPWLKGGQPYADSAEMVADARGGHLFIFRGGDFPEGHLMKAPSGVHCDGLELSFNDLFRGVHDIFGHALYGNGFGPRGEDLAWRVHAAMFCPRALPSMSAETRGQNSWINFGRHVRGRDVPARNRPYACQKNALLPSEFLDTSHLTPSEFHI
ncbi:hypothetical protein [Paludisphaera mucosa]|uniref:Uncharacterized protein n=1 Tax=Paludisphaera mucosa TaxID=3030827 RepID=A0ABT6FLL7_9BACT|nr:hypothetical protein [Paludisphaera mucosa]MDG3008467.1 hypothetical protein [Paludisphaera mucosa]